MRRTRAAPRSASRLQRIAMIAAGVLVALVVAELALRAGFGSGRWWRASLVPHSGGAPVRASVDPVLGYELTPGAVATHDVAQWQIDADADGCAIDEVERTIEIRVNRHGFRGPDWSDEPAADVLRVAVLGDSQVLGEALALDQTIPARLQAHLSAAHPARAFEVLDLAVVGYNSEQEHRALTRSALPLRPDVVLVGYVSNDPELDRAAVFFYPRTANPLTWLMLTRVVRYGLVLRHRHVRELFHDRVLYQDYAVWLHQGPYWTATRAILRDMRRRCDEAGVGFGLFLVPDLAGVESFDGPSVYTPIYESLVALRDEGIPVIDPIPAFAGRPCAPEDYRVSSNDLHLGPLAADVVARAVADSDELRALLDARVASP